MRLIIGLGNPGFEYVYTRHNIGWLVLDRVISRSLNDAAAPKGKFSGEFWAAGGGLALLKPHTWMNLSGKSAREAFDFYKMAPEDMLIVCDDVALPFGKLRVRAKGSAGGHNGLASVIGALGTLEVPRLRVGVGAKPDGGNLKNWVLGHFEDDEREALPGVLEKAADAALIWADEGTEKAMNVTN